MEANKNTGAQAAQTVGGMRQRRVARGAKNSRGGASGEEGAPAQSGDQKTNIMKFFSDDGTGLQVGPVTVLVMSLGFMCVVVMLHVLQKFRMSWSA